MAHYAKVRDSKVLKVLVAEADFFDSFVDNSPGEWIQTSYNTRGGVHYEPNTNTPSGDQSKALRKNYACKDYTYDHVRDAFYNVQPFPSWVLDETTCLWGAPVDHPSIADPTDVGFYNWNETTKAWDEIV